MSLPDLKSYPFPSANGLSFILRMQKIRLNSLVSIVLLTVCIFYYILFLVLDGQTGHPIIPGLGVAPLFYSAKFLDDYVLAVLVGVFLIAASRWFTLDTKSSGLISSFIRTCSKCSFSLYVIHFPLMAIGGALFASGNLVDFSHLQGILLVLLIVLSLLFYLNSHSSNIEDS